jgi:hypothetical protein
MPSDAQEHNAQDDAKREREELLDERHAQGLDD